MAHRSTNEWYVAKNGNDANNGGPTSPFLTIANAIAQAEAYILAGAPWSTDMSVQTIFIAPGVYAEQLSITTGFIRLCGTAPGGMRMTSNPVSGGAQRGLDTVITSSNGTGPIVLNINTTIANATVNNRRIILEDLTLTNTGAYAGLAGPCLGTGSTSSARLFTCIMQNCTLNSGTSVIGWIPAGASVLYAENVTINQYVATLNYNLPVVNVAGDGVCLMRFCNVTAYQNVPCVLIGGAAQMQLCQLNNFYSTTATAAAAPIMRISSTLSYVTPVSQCVFAYTSPGSTDRPNTSTAIEFSGASAQSAILQNNIFLLLGTTRAGYAIRATLPATPHFIYAVDNYVPFGQAFLSNVKLQTMSSLMNED